MKNPKIIYIILIVVCLFFIVYFYKKNIDFNKSQIVTVNKDINNIDLNKSTTVNKDINSIDFLLENLSQSKNSYEEAKAIDYLMERTKGDFYYKFFVTDKFGNTYNRMIYADQEKNYKIDDIVEVKIEIYSLKEADLTFKKIWKAKNIDNIYRFFFE